MKFWAILALLALALDAAALFVQYDLRGWTPDNPRDPAAIVQPTPAGGSAFAVRDCLPGSVRPWEPPTAEEYSGSATLTVLACRSRASAMPVALAYLGVVATGLVLLLARRGRRRGVEPKGAGGGS
ncbi:MAG: hypothetical protein J0H01_35510 [Rhizobiales bacterium]|nr:hypothetical protein [Hyphomicrobiales bacterium]